MDRLSDDLLALLLDTLAGLHNARRARLVEEGDVSVVDLGRRGPAAAIAPLRSTSRAFARARSLYVSDLGRLLVRRECDVRLWACTATQRQDIDAFDMRDHWRAIGGAAMAPCFLFSHVRLAPDSLCGSDDAAPQSVGTPQYVLRWVACTSEGLANVVPLRGAILSEHRVMPLFGDPDMTTLQQIIYGAFERDVADDVGAPLSDADARTVLVGVLVALVQLHDRNVAHGNLTPYRVAVDATDYSRVALLDLSFSPPRGARIACADRVSQLPSRAAPELQTEPVVMYTEANDVWACAMMVYEMLHGARRFGGDAGSMTPVVHAMLEPRVRHRITARAALELLRAEALPPALAWPCLRLPPSLVDGALVGLLSWLIALSLRDDVHVDHHALHVALAYLRDDAGVASCSRLERAARAIGAAAVASCMEMLDAPSLLDFVSSTVEAVTTTEVRMAALALVARRRCRLLVPFTADDRMAATLRRVGVTMDSCWAPEPSRKVEQLLALDWRGRALRAWLRVVTWSLLVRCESSMCVGAAVALVATILLDAAAPDLQASRAIMRAWVRATVKALETDFSSDAALHLHAVPAHRDLCGTAELPQLIETFCLPQSPRSLRVALATHCSRDRCASLGAYDPGAAFESSDEKCYLAGPGDAVSIGAVTCALLFEWLATKAD
jgi:hypothetical protein